tara:strand:+ start:407 stop:874 length:468 start_codon:yes stop_codon:yes gene_type:complete
MIQIIQSATIDNSIFIRLNVYDNFAFKIGSGYSFNPLVKMTSQETNKEKIFNILATTTTNAQRYFAMLFLTMKNLSSENTLLGLVCFGTRDFPYGVYDIAIYENSSSTNQNPTLTYKTVYQGLANVVATENPAIEYTKYQEDQEQVVYITNTPIT